jgi:hypothetical protein
MTILEICEWLESTALAVLVRESVYGFPILVGIHILGLILSVGTLLWVDLRLLGVSLRKSRVSEVYRGLSPWFLSGFVVMFVSGGALFTGFATSAYGNLYFRIKVAALLLAGANALGFHVMTQRTSPVWDAAPRPPAPARLAGLASIVLWAVVIVAGRMISYTMF